jgi:hypothetical protein
VAKADLESGRPMVWLLTGCDDWPWGIYVSLEQAKAALADFEDGAADEPKLFGFPMGAPPLAGPPDLFVELPYEDALSELGASYKRRRYRDRREKESTRDFIDFQVAQPPWYAEEGLGLAPLADNLVLKAGTGRMPDALKPARAGSVGRKRHIIGRVQELLNE